MNSLISLTFADFAATAAVLLQPGRIITAAAVPPVTRASFFMNSLRFTLPERYSWYSSFTFSVMIHCFGLRSIMSERLRLAGLFLDSLDMSSSQSLDFAPKLEVTADLIISEDTEAIDNGSGLSDGLHHLIRIKIHVS